MGPKKKKHLKKKQAEEKKVRTKKTRYKLCREKRKGFSEFLKKTPRKKPGVTRHFRGK